MLSDRHADLYREVRRKTGESTQNELWARDIGVVLETKDRLDMPADMVRMTAFESSDPGVGATYRYECLRSLETRSNRWVLVPAKWTRKAGYALIVTPDESNRITTTVHAGLAAQTGSGDNVNRYWQCPEVAPTFKPSDLDGKLLTAQEVQTVLAAGGLEPDPVRSQVPNMVGNATSGPPPQCVTAVNHDARSSFLPDYRDLAGITLQEQSMQRNGPGERVWVDEGVTLFPNADEAFKFVVATDQIWRRCAGTVVGVTRRNAIEPRRLGRLHPNAAEGIPWVEDSAPADGSSADCSQAIVAKSNIVVDVDVCGSAPPGAALIAKAIRDKIPLERPADAE